ncbi:Ppx/GppA family phosphatase [Guptibacillus spartinae]|uniref:Ppx/GppA family phosphatase n=1 Tax=Guptibacillus spartinae TaxID=3025679 RepID=UPI002360C86F|nr:Ppx/GppA family phosphatase [Pseudalkalibacillus spartinae]
MSQKPYYAVIDMGSNTIRLMIYCINAFGELEEEQNLKYSARLRTYLEDDLTINKKGIEIILKTLRHFQVITKSFKLKDVPIIATAAVRQAKNQNEIRHMIENETDFQFKILSEKEEAYYGYLSVIQTTNLENGYTIDIGGGSTEITYMENRKMIHFHSFPFGALTLQKEFIINEKPSKKELAKLRQFVIEQFKLIPWIKNRKLRVAGIGGSARNLSLIHQKKNDYPLSGIHHYEFPTEQIGTMIDFLSEIPLSSRKKVDGLSKERADIIIPAVQAIEAFTSYVNAPEFLMCRKGLREGFMYEKLITSNMKDRYPNITERNIDALKVKYNINDTKVEANKKITLMLSKTLLDEGYLSFEDANCMESILFQASQLSYLGDHIESESVSQHTYYILSNTALDGMNHKQRIILALLASYKNKSTFEHFAAPYSSWFKEGELNQIELLGAILKLAYFLNTTNRNIVEQITLENKKHDSFTLMIGCNDEFLFEQQKCEKHIKHLEKALSIEVTLNFRLLS